MLQRRGNERNANHSPLKFFDDLLARWDIDPLDCRVVDEDAARQFGWHGEDEEGMPVDDIGWALLEDGELRGTICLNASEQEVQFVAKRESPKAPAEGKHRRTTEKPKLKQGKSSASVRTRLTQLEQSDGTWASNSTDVERAFPAIARWVRDGHIEIGDQDGFGFVVRALDYGGLIFESDKPKTLAEAMAALERGLVEYFANNDIEI